jgi:AcrR family transcriptional regulator
MSSHVTEHRATAERERLVDAVERCFERFGVNKTTLADVAEEAQVSRQTVYRYFGRRSALFRSVVMRTLERHWKAIGRELADCGDLEQWILDAILFCLRQVPGERQHLLIKQLHLYDDGMAIALSDEGLQPALAAMRRQFDLAEERSLLKPGVSMALIVEWMYRMIHSYVLLPSHRLVREADLRRWLQQAAMSNLFRERIRPRAAGGGTAGGSRKARRP